MRMERSACEERACVFEEVFAYIGRYEVFSL